MQILSKSRSNQVSMRRTCKPLARSPHVSLKFSTCCTRVFRVIFFVILLDFADWRLTDGPTDQRTDASNVPCRTPLLKHYTRVFRRQKNAWPTDGLMDQRTNPLTELRFTTKNDNLTVLQRRVNFIFKDKNSIFKSLKDISRGNQSYA